MDDNDRFMARWKPIHEKTVVKYVLLNILIYFALTTLSTIFFLWIYPSIKNRTLSNDEIHFVIVLMAMPLLISTVTRLATWFSGERRYRKLIGMGRIPLDRDMA